MVDNDGRDAAGSGDFTASWRTCSCTTYSTCGSNGWRKHRCRWQKSRRPLCGRLCDGVPTTGVRRPKLAWRHLRERFAKFGLATASREDPADRIRAIRGGTRKRRGAGPPETFDFLGFTHIGGEDPARRFHDPPQNVAEEVPRQADGDQGRTVTEDARRPRAGRCVAAKRVSWLVPVLRCARQLRAACGSSVDALKRCGSACCDAAANAAAA